jgi:hypothetical protein
MGRDAHQSTEHLQMHDSGEILGDLPRTPIRLALFMPV